MSSSRNAAGGTGGAAVWHTAAGASCPPSSSALVLVAFKGSLEDLMLEATRHRSLVPLRDAIHHARTNGHAAADVFNAFVLACDSLHGTRQNRPMLLRSLKDLTKMASLQIIPITPTVVQVVCNLVRKMLGSAHSNAFSAAGASRNSLCGSKEDLQSETNNTARAHSTRPRSMSQTRSGLAADFDSSAGTRCGVSNASFHSDVGGELAQLPVVDDELQISILQMLMSFLSACELSNVGLADLMGVVFTMYIHSTPTSVVEASCAATIEQRTIAVLQKLRNIGGVDHVEGGGNSGMAVGGTAGRPRDAKFNATHVSERDDVFTARMQMVAYVKDVCALCADASPKWLKLGTPHSSGISQETESMDDNNGWSVAPRRLRVLLLETLIKYFESYPITSSQGITIFFVQCLNHDIVPLVLGATNNGDSDLTAQRTSEQRGYGIVELVPDSGDDEDLFILTQKLGVTLLSTALPPIHNNMHTILRFNISCLERCMPDADSKIDANRVLSLLALWRKQMNNHKVLRRLLLAASDSRRPFPQAHENSPLQQQESHPSWGDADFHTEPEDVTYRISISSDKAGDPSASLPHSRYLCVGHTPLDKSEDLPQPFAQFVVAAAKLLASMIFSAGSEVLDRDRTDALQEGAKSTTEMLSPPVTATSILKSNFRAVVRTQRLLQQKVFGIVQEGDSGDQTVSKGSPTRVPPEERPSHLKTAVARDILDFLAVFTQSFAHVVEALAREKNDDALRDMKSTILSLHPFLFRSFTLAARQLGKGGVIYTVMRGITNMVYISCFLHHSEIRSSYLGAFHALLRQECKHPKTGEVVVHQRAVDERALSTRKPTSEGNTPARLVDHSLEALLEKQYVLNCVISIAFNMGGSLGDGWRGVVSCLLFAPQVFCCLQRIIQRQQYAEGAVKEAIAGDTAHDGEYLVDALRALFINCALGNSGESILSLLANFVKEACNCLPFGTDNDDVNVDVDTSYLSAVQLVCECCSLALLAVAGRGDELPSVLLLQLWRPVRVLYQRVFGPHHLMLLVKASGSVEELQSVLAALLENVMVLAAQFCRCVHYNGNSESCLIRRKHGPNSESQGGLSLHISALGPFSSAGLVTLLSRLIDFLGQPQSACLEENDPRPSTQVLATSADGNAADDDARPQALVSVTEMLDAIYGSLRKLPSVATITTLTANEDSMKKTSSDNAEVLNTLSGNLSLLLLKEILKLIQGFGEDLCGMPWEHLLRLLRRSATMHNPVDLLSSLSSTETRGLTGLMEVASNHCSHMSAGVRQGISVGFRTLETVQHSHITSLDGPGLRELIRCGGAFMTYRLPQGEEQRLNINLSAVQLLWSIADYNASLGQSQDEVAVVERRSEVVPSCSVLRENVTCDLLWCTLLLQLYNGCLDLRPEVRQSALKTLFSLIQAYSNRLFADSWRTFLREVVGPLMEIILEAVNNCARAPNSSTATNSSSQGPSKSDPGPYNPKQSCGNNEGHQVTQLLRHFDDNPAFLDDVRVTIMDSVCRVFISHYSAMYGALVIQEKDEKKQADGDILLHKTLSRFIDVCAASRLVSRATSGEAVALSAIRALHGLLVSFRSSTVVSDQMPLLRGKEHEAAWSAVEGLIHRDDGCHHTANAQCTAAVVSTIVSALGDVVVLQRSNNPQQEAQAMSEQRERITVSTSSLLGTLRQSFAKESGGNESDADVRDYFPQYLKVSELCLRSHAVTDSYFFPSRVQVALIEVWKRLWTLLNVQERGAVISIVLQQFPSEENIATFVVQRFRACNPDKFAALARGTELESLAEHPEAISLRRTLDPGAHPSFLMELISFIHFVSSEERSTVQDDRHQPSHGLRDSFPLPIMPAVIRALGVLLLLEYATPEVLATPCGGLLYQIPGEFFNSAEKCLEGLLTDMLWGVREQCPQATTIDDSGECSVLFTSRHEGFLAFCSCLTSLTSLAKVMVAAVESESGGAPEGNVTVKLINALQRLERLILLLGKLIPHVLCHASDMSVVTDALRVLVPASSVDSPLFADVVQRSLCLLRQWSSSTGDVSICENVKLMEESQQPREEEGGKANVDILEGGDENELANKRLQSMARASIGARNRTVFRRFLLDCGNEEARHMVKLSLQTIALIHPVRDAARNGGKEEKVYSSPVDDELGKLDVTSPATDGSDNSEDDAVSLRHTLLQMIRLVSHTGNDPELALLLSNAMLGVCASLGLSEVP